MVSAMLLPDPELEGSIWAGLGRADPNSQILGWICRAAVLGSRHSAASLLLPWPVVPVWLPDLEPVGSI